MTRQRLWIINYPLMEINEVTVSIGEYVRRGHPVEWVFLLLRILNIVALQMMNSFDRLVQQYTPWILDFFLSRERLNGRRMIFGVPGWFMSLFLEWRIFSNFPVTVRFARYYYRRKGLARLEVSSVLLWIHKWCSTNSNQCAGKPQSKL